MSAEIKSGLIVLVVALAFYAGIRYESFGKVLSWTIVIAGALMTWRALRMFIADHESRK